MQRRFWLGDDECVWSTLAATLEEALDEACDHDEHEGDETSLFAVSAREECATCKGRGEHNEGCADAVRELLVGCRVVLVHPEEPACVAPWDEAGVTVEREHVWHGSEMFNVVGKVDTQICSVCGLARTRTPHEATGDLLVRYESSEYETEHQTVLDEARERGESLGEGAAWEWLEEHELSDDALVVDGGDALVAALVKAAKDRDAATDEGVLLGLGDLFYAEFSEAAKDALFTARVLGGEEAV